MITKEQVLQQYLTNLSTANYQGIVTLFANDALVVSPLYGEMSAAQFYRDLLQDTKCSQLKLINMFIGGSKADSAAVQF